MAEDITGVSLRTQLRELGDLLHHVLDVHFEVLVDVGEGCPDVAVAPQALESALVELVVNARDAMPAGGKLKLSARSCSTSAGVQAQRGDARDWVAVSVADTGCGMTVKEREQAADLGYSTKLNPRNGGRGLTRAARLARYVGGTLCICSAPGIGTVVTLYLPRANA